MSETISWSVLRAASALLCICTADAAVAADKVADKAIVYSVIPERFLLSDFPQEANARRAVNAAGRPSEGAPAPESVKTVNYELAWATDNMDRIRKRWSAETGR